MGDEKEILNVVNGSSTSKDEPFKLKFESILRLFLIKYLFFLTLIQVQVLAD